MSISKKLQALTAHMLMTVIVLFSMSASASAQTTPDQKGQSTQQQGTQKHGAQQQGTRQGSQQQGGQQGWQWFDDDATRDMNMDQEARSEMRDMDDRYRKEYDAMGDTPWTHSNYQDLTDRRNAEIQRTLTPEQHKQWSSRTGTKGSGTRGGSSPSQDRGTSTPGTR